MCGLVEPVSCGDRPGTPGTPVVGIGTCGGSTNDIVLILNLRLYWIRFLDSSELWLDNENCCNVVGLQCWPDCS